LYISVDLSIEEDFNQGLVMNFTTHTVNTAQATAEAMVNAKPFKVLSFNVNATRYPPRIPADNSTNNE